MRATIIGGAGFVGLNIAQHLLDRGDEVTLFDRADLPEAARKAFASHETRLRLLRGDVTDRGAVEAARDAAEPERILAVNLLAQIPMLEAARRVNVRRVINLSSGSAYGASRQLYEILDETTPCDAHSLYAITKFASERVAARLADLWEADIVSVRLSAVFGPFERPGGVRDTPSPQGQIVDCMRRGESALLGDPGLRDWVYAPDVAEAVAVLLDAQKLREVLYNISSGASFAALAWGETMAALRPGFVCRLAGNGETPTVTVHGPQRAPLSASRLADEFGWRAQFDCEASAAHLTAGSGITREIEMRLAERVAIITGGGSGIGRASAVMFAREGAFVALVDRDAAGAEQTLVMLREAGGEGSVHVGDVGEADFARATVERVAAKRGRLDVLMTAAGFSCGGTVVTTDPADWDAVFHANVGGTWLWARAAVPIMQRRGRGAIITLASQLAIAGGKNNSAYIAAKGAIVSLTLTMAVDFATDGIRVNAIAPGAIDTPLLRRSFARRADPDAVRETSRQRHAMKRFGEAEEVAAAALYLASDESSTTGVVLPVDGGWLAA
jgi:2-keto-3-deoxy-L-fuconate dehydrogenase